jgi:hypothetical protein
LLHHGCNFSLPVQESCGIVNDIHFAKTNKSYYISFMWKKYHIRIRRLFIFSLLFVAGVNQAQNMDPGVFISAEKARGYFVLSEPGYTVPLCVDTHDFPGVIRAVNDLIHDLGLVTGNRPELITESNNRKKEMIIVGTAGKSALIEDLVRTGKISLSALQGKRESFILCTVEKPFRGVNRALVIAGSDKRGTIYGIYDVSLQIGVSPWYWWADVPAKRQSCLYVKPGLYAGGEPAVQYRGIFINDEAPALSGWAREKFGGFNHLFYEKVFELILRLRGNFLWPAMWGNAFFDDDTLNFRMADEYGIVIGTSHHEPMMRAHDEWRRYGSGPWNYETNEKNLQDFWEKGIRRMGTKESIVTVGMRGDGDMPMSEESNIALLERIVSDQRKILAEITGKESAAIPQVWALYKEVQDYYDKGMRVPDDVTLLLCDDNWGNVRRLPLPEEQKRTGGYGMYYHFDFVGGPRNYKWINTNSIPRIWEQMHLAYRYGTDRIWIVNVGDIKPMELPVSFFLAYAWDPEKWPADRVQDFTRLWAEQQFGRDYADSIAYILDRYTQFNARRKPELLSPETYSLINYREAESVMGEYSALSEKAQRIAGLLPDEYKDAYYQLVLFPVEACCNINELYVTVARNRLYASQGRVNTNTLAARAKELFKHDSILSDYYNTKMAGGKWNHMMDQTHIGYTGWQQPDKNIMPEVDRILSPDSPEMGVSIEGSESWWPAEKSPAVLPSFSVCKKDSHYLEIFNRGRLPFDFEIKTMASWLIIKPSGGRIYTDQRVWLSLDYSKIPAGDHIVPVVITGQGQGEITVFVRVHHPDLKGIGENIKFIETDGYASLEAADYDQSVAGPIIKWLCIPGIGRTGSGMTPIPVTVQSQIPGKENSPRLEYRVFFTDTGKMQIRAFFSPTLNFTGGTGLRYAFSVDDEIPEIINIHEGDTIPDWKYPQYWNDAVSNNIRVSASAHRITAKGFHTLKFWMVDPGLVLQKIVVDMGGVKPSYLGPPESLCHLK